MAPTSRLGDDLATLFSQGSFTAAVICFTCWSITPLSWFALIYQSIHLAWGIPTPRSWLLRPIWQLVVAYSCLEVPFSLYLLSLKHRIAPKPERKRPFERDLITLLFRRSLTAGMLDLEREKHAAEAIAFDLEHRLEFDDPRAADFRSQMSRWFLDADWQDVKRDNILEWLAWGLCGGADLERLRTEGDEDAKELLDFLDTAVSLVEARSGYKFPEGRSDHVKCIRLHLDPVNVASRPLVLYAAIAALSSITMLKAYRAGFFKSKEGDIEYLLRLPSTWNPDQAMHDSSHRPLLVLHGLGIGMSQYISVIEALSKMPDLQHRPVIVLRQPWISMRIWHHRFLQPPGRVEMATSLKNALVKHGMDRCGIDVLSHSNGTIIHGWLIKTAPELIRRSLFVDPVCFCLFEPDVPYSFLYRQPRTGIERLMLYFVGTCARSNSLTHAASEIGHANLLQRNFEWTDNLLWAEEVPNLRDPTQVITVLSGQDAIVPVERVRKYLLANGMREWRDDEKQDAGGLFIDEPAAHGEALMTNCASFERIFTWLSRHN